MNSQLLDNPTPSAPPAAAPQPARPAHKFSPKKKGRWLGRSVLVLAILGTATGGALAIPSVREQVGLEEQSSEASGLLTAAVRKAPFQLTVTEKGTLDSMRNAILVSKVEGQTTIISIVPEGTQVQKGDVVCELDSSALVEKETTQRIAVTQATALLEQAQENVEIQKTQNESDIAAARLKLRLAELDLKKFEEGEFKQQVNELAGAVQLANENLTRARESQAFVKRMSQKGYKSQNDLEAERIAVAKADIDLKVAQEKLKVLQEFTYTRTLEELRANASEFARELERVQRKAQAALAQTNAELAKCQLTAEVENNKHRRLLAQIEACKLVAPQDGQVVYANPRDARSDSQIIEEGATVRERQAIINLPDFDAMKVMARIHESKISSIRPGLVTNVRVDAYPDQIFRGAVDSVSSVPMSTNSFSRGDVKEYEAVIRLLDTGEKVNKLRPGLTANIEIVVNQVDDMLQTPMQSIVTIASRQFAFVENNGKVERREIKIGQTNERMIEIVDGLKEGDRVVMSPTQSFGKELDELREMYAKEDATKAPPANAPVIAAVPVPPAGGPAAPSVPGGERQSRPEGPNGAGGDRPAPDPTAIFARLDKDQDGKLTADDLGDASRMATLDKNGDGSVSLEEFKSAPRQNRRPRPQTENIGG